MKPKFEMSIDNERHDELLYKAHSKCAKEKPKKEITLDVHPGYFAVAFFFLLVITLFTEHFEVTTPW